MTIDRAALMKTAWATVRRLRRWYPTTPMCALLSQALKLAWYDAKQAARFAAYAAAQVASMASRKRPADQIRTDILALECRDCLRGSDWQRLDALRAELHAAI